MKPWRQTVLCSSIPRLLPTFLLASFRGSRGEPGNGASFLSLFHTANWAWVWEWGDDMSRSFYVMPCCPTEYADGGTLRKAIKNFVSCIHCSPGSAQLPVRWAGPDNKANVSSNCWRIYLFPRSTHFLGVGEYPSGETFQLAWCVSVVS